MKYDISVVTSYALQTLACPLKWRVHSVYRKTINIQSGSHLLALQASHSPVSPVSLVTVLETQDFNGLDIKAGQPVTVEGTLIRMGGEGNGEPVTFDWQGSSVFDSLMREGEWGSAGKLVSTDRPGSADGQTHAAKIRKALELSHTGGFRTIFIPGLPDDNFLVNAASRKRLSACLSFSEHGDYEGAAAELSGLIGLGIGLTPSGDDFLCGVLAGFILSGRTNHPLFSPLRLKIRENLMGTNDISRAFLQCALEYNFSKPIKELPGAASAGDICRAFEEIGHSSGMDTLCGVLFCLLTNTGND